MKRSVMLMLFFMVAALIASQAAMHVIDMRHGLSESRIRKICQMPDGRIAIATTSTIDVFDGTRFSSYPLIPSYAYPLECYQGKRQMRCDSGGRIWLRNKGKLFVVDARSGKLVKDVGKLMKELGLQENDIAAWPQVRVPTTYDSINDVSSMIRDSFGGLWIGTLESGIYYLNDRRERQFNTYDSVYRHKPKALFSSKRTESLAERFAPFVTNCSLETNDGYALIGTLNGLLVFDEANQHIATIDSHYGLISDNVLSVISDFNRDIWIATSRGISRIKKLGQEKFRITNYGELDGIRLEGREFRPRQIFCDSVGCINVGFGGGVVKFFPDSVNAPRYSFYYPDTNLQEQVETDDNSETMSRTAKVLLIVVLVLASAYLSYRLLRKKKLSEKNVEHDNEEDSTAGIRLDSVSDDIIDRMKSDSRNSDADDEFMRKIKTIVEEHLGDEEFSVQTLSECMAMDRTGLYRKLQTLTGKSPSVYIREIRLNVAARLLKESDLPVSEISMKTGYSTTKYFNKVFRQTFSVSPEEYRTKET